MTEIVKLHNWTAEVPDGYHDLVSRRADLERIIPEKPEDYPAVSALWNQLADDFEAIGYKVAGGSARRKAAHWSGNSVPRMEEYHG